MQIDLVTHAGGRYRAVYVNGELAYNGKIIPDAIWIRIVRQVGYSNFPPEFRIWAHRSEVGIDYPELLIDVMDQLIDLNKAR